MYNDECTRSRDIDNLESKTRDLDFEIDRAKHDLQREIDYLREIIGDLKDRMTILENRNG